MASFTVSECASPEASVKQSCLWTGSLQLLLEAQVSPTQENVTYMVSVLVLYFASFTFSFKSLVRKMGKKMIEGWFRPLLKTQGWVMVPYKSRVALVLTLPEFITLQWHLVYWCWEGLCFLRPLPLSVPHPQRIPYSQFLSIPCDWNFQPSNWVDITFEVVQLLAPMYFQQEELRGITEQGLCLHSPYASVFMPVTKGAAGTLASRAERGEQPKWGKSPFHYLC